MLRRGNAVEQFAQPLAATLGERDGHSFGVDDPPQNCLDRRPGPIALQELFQGHRFLPTRVIEGVKWAQNFVNGMEQETTSVLELGGRALRHANKIIHEDVESLGTLAVGQEWVAFNFQFWHVVWDGGGVGSIRGGIKSVRAEYRPTLDGGVGIIGDSFGDHTKVRWRLSPPHREG
jgi:hypothetical protein